MTRGDVRFARKLELTHAPPLTPGPQLLAERRSRLSERRFLRGAAGHIYPLILLRVGSVSMTCGVIDGLRGLHRDLG
jgi:hypothetical protein